MDAVCVGNTIAKLRRKHGMTQADLAKKLNISNKTVGRWEQGLGYPEVTQFPQLAALFGVTVDLLMTGSRRGIAFAGNILADVVKTIERYPEAGMLCDILQISRSVGGCVPNTAINMARIDRAVPLAAIGRVGDDADGGFVVSQMQSYGIDCSRVSVSKDVPTSFSDVMSLPSGERTFFHARGANAAFSPKDVDLDNVDSQILHIGYILVLDAFDQPDEQYGTVMARFLHAAQHNGIKTSIDVVSREGADYKGKVLPALPYCHYVIINEVESSMLFDLPPYDEQGKLLIDNIRQTAQKMAACGVREKVIIHCKQAGFCYDVQSQSFTVVPSLLLDPQQIRGSVGAGDAFCAGCLYALYKGWDDEKMLAFASGAAACNLFADNAVDGMRSHEEIWKLIHSCQRRTL